jgi:hypothetical protein
MIERLGLSDRVCSKYHAGVFRVGTVSSLAAVLIALALLYFISFSLDKEASKSVTTVEVTPEEIRLPREQTVRPEPQSERPRVNDSRDESTVGTGADAAEPASDEETRSQGEDSFRQQFEDRSRRQLDMRLAVINQTEDVDPVWAAQTERQLMDYVRNYLQDSPQLRERFSLTNIGCRTTVCMIELVDYGSGEFHDGRDPISGLKDDLVEQAWAAQFDNSDAHMIGSVLNGLLEYSLFLKRSETPQYQ